jgi:hypothetical protein
MITIMFSSIPVAIIMIAEEREKEGRYLRIEEWLC